MTDPYGFPSPDACRAVEALLEIEPLPWAQGWEVEQADGAHIPKALNAFADKSRDLDVRSALGLLMLFSCIYYGGDESSAPPPVVEAVRKAILADREVKARMYEFVSYWDDQAVEAVLNGQPIPD